MSISIIGAGNVGIALATAFIRKGKKITFGVTHPEKYQDIINRFGGNATVVTVDEAIAKSDIIILAVPYHATEEIAQQVKNWQGKILVDATNPIAPMLSGLSIGATSSGAEEIAKMAQNARVIKAFNTTGAENMANSQYTGGLPWMPVCGDDASARQTVMELATLIGFDAVDMGSLASARYLEPFAMAWIHLAIKQGKGRQFAFSILNRTV